MGSAVQADAVVHFCGVFQPGCVDFNGPVVLPKWQQSEAVIGGVHVVFKDGAGLSKTACCEDVVQGLIIFGDVLLTLWRHFCLGLCSLGTRQSFSK